MHWRRKWQPTPVFLPGESQERRSLVGCRLWGRTVEHDLTVVYTLSVSAQTHLLKFPETSLNKRKRKIQLKLTRDSYALSLGN